jgi:cyclomaltodextrinase / maltogenic alpha-amylase / neopullulanase
MRKGAWLCRPLQAGLLLLAAQVCAQTAAPAPAPATTPAAAPTCSNNPLPGRSLFLRGSFNAWAAAPAQRFTWACDRYELVTALKGEHRYKVGDEGWSADADLGRAPAQPGAQKELTASAPVSLQARGTELESRFDGIYRFTLTMTDRQAPQLAVQSCPAVEGGAPLGTTTLFLRGTPNNWAALDTYAFQFSCDAYYLNVKLNGTHEFKVADGAWTGSTTVGPAGLAGTNPQTAANFVHRFEGEHTVRLVFAGSGPQLSVGPKTFADPRAPSVTNPVALSLRFDSRNLADKAPFGAITPGTTVHYGVSALPGVDALTLVVEKRRLEGNQELLDYTPVARVPMKKAANAAGGTGSTGGLERWTASHTYGDPAIYGHWFEASINGALYAYQNNADPVFWTRENGTGGLGAVADRPANAGPVRRYRQTVFAADFKVPAWAKDAVYYYIFPDRFRNGNPANDPVPGRDKYQNSTVEKHANWLSKPYKPGTGDGSDAVYNNDFYGGDLQGVIDKLDYIRDLGANTIYLTPVFRAASNHKYDTADYKNIDPAFGTNADFERLCLEAAKRGLRVIPDASLNHTGADSIYFDRFNNFKSGGASLGAFAGNQINLASPYASWYSFDATQTSPDKQFKGWVGVADLPELNKSSPVAGPGRRRLAHGRGALGARRLLARVARSRQSPQA